MKTITIISKEEYNKLPDTIEDVDVSKDFGISDLYDMFGKTFSVSGKRFWINIEGDVIKDYTFPDYVIPYWLIKKQGQLEFEF